MTSRLLFVVLLVCARPAAGADSIVKADARDSVTRAAAPDTATMPEAVRDPAILWQFDTHG